MVPSHSIAGMSLEGIARSKIHQVMERMRGYMAGKHAAEQWQGRREEREEGRVKKRKNI